MAKGKGKKGKRRGDDSDDSDGGENTPTSTPVADNDDAGLSRKQKRAQKLKGKKKQQNNNGNDSDEDDAVLNLVPQVKETYGSDSDDDDTGGRSAPSKKLTKKQLKRQKEKEEAEARAKASAFAGSESEDGEDAEDQSDDDIPHPGKKNKEKQNIKQKGKQASKSALSDDDDAEDEDDMNIPQPAKKNINKLNKKKKGKQASKFAFSDDDENEEEDEEVEIPQPVKKNNKKHKSKQKGTQASEFAISDDEEEGKDEDSQDELPQPVKKNKKQNKRGKGKQSSQFAISDDEEVDEEEEELSQPRSKGKKQQKETQSSRFAISDDEEEEKEECIAEAMEKMEINDESDDGDKKKKKKDKKKDKKEKKSKLEKKLEAAAELAAEVGHAEKDDDLDDVAKEKEKKKAEKVARKAEKEAKKARKAEKEAKKIAKLQGKGSDDEGGEDDDEEGDEDDDGVFYGAPDDHAWTDKSHAIAESEKKKDDGPDLSLIYGPDGKKLSNKERKKLIKAREAAARAAEYEKQAAKASLEGAQFACSQTAVNENDPQWQNSLDISIPSFNISAAGKVLFKDAELNIAHGRRYGLVGPNGKGKSTLLKMIASRDLILPPRVDFLYVEQEVQADNTPAVDAVLKADKVRWNLLEEEKSLTEAIDNGEDDPKKFKRLQEVLDELNTIGAASAEAKARRILFGLGFDGDMQTKPTKMFSGGWRMRISLARALFIEPTLLMLDEPTNHLDLNAVIWLDNYLLNWKKTLLIVSHDQDFLNSVCDEILHIEDLKLASYKGNYDSFKKAEATKLKQQLKDWEKQEKRLRELKRQGQSKAKATETVKKNKREPGARAAKKAEKQAIASGSATAQNAELIKRPKEYTVQIQFPEVAELSRPVMEVNQVFFRYSEKHPVIFDCIDFGIDMDSRICVVGPNGAGKSTLLKLLTGEIQPVKGEVKRNPRLRMGIYNQHFVDRLPMHKTPVEHLRDRYEDEDYQSIRNRLGKYGLEGHAHEVTMRDLSGGQKARVVFVDLSLQRPHILLLDEPTNNLDIETIDALIKAINEFNGGIVVVTHDQRLIDECECELWVVEEEGVTKWAEGFDDYKDGILQKLEEQAKKDEETRNERLEAAAKARDEKIARLKSKTK